MSSDSQERKTTQHKTYISLLQNKVLGVDNSQLLSEIHNYDEYKAPYSSLQKDPHSKSLFSAEKSVKSIDGSNVEKSPYNSKFNVLKLSSSKK